MGIKHLFSCLLVIFLSSCAVLSKNTDLVLSQEIETPEVLNLQSEELLNLPPAEHKPVIAVYANSFQDLTGQRKSNSSFAMFSTAVTQAPEALLIRALKHAANGKFFRVVERVGLENLTKERQLIRSTRENFEEDQQLQPLLFAGIIVQGGVIAFDTNIESGGIGARYLGIGNSTVYREDIVTISLRLVSVATGEILLETTVSKNILSTSISQDIFRYIEAGTELVEIEGGVAENEAGSIALQKAIEAGVLDLIKLGIERGYWKYEKLKINEPCDVDTECVDIRG